MSKLLVILRKFFTLKDFCIACDVGKLKPCRFHKCRISFSVGLQTSGGGERDGTRRDGVREEGAYTKYFPFKAERDRGGEEEIKKEKEERQRGREGERE